MRDARRVPPPPTPGPTPTADLGGPWNPGVCQDAHRRAPAAAVSDALANPSGVRGYGERCHPSQPAGPFNRVRDQLAIEQAAKPYHPLYNGLAWKCGCP